MPKWPLMLPGMLLYFLKIKKSINVSLSIFKTRKSKKNGNLEIVIEEK